MSNQTLAARTIGKFAWDLLAEPQTAGRLGLTRRGAFYLLTCGRVIFLSSEPFCGPLTVNFQEFPGDMQELQLEAFCSQEAIRFLDAGLEIDLRPAQVWEPLLPVPGRVLPVECRNQHLAQIIAQVAEGNQLDGLARLLPSLSGNKILAMPDAYDPLITRVKEIARAGVWDEAQLDRLAQALVDFLGLGRGLTPSGDDFVLGFLLAVNRWGKVLFPGIQPAALNKVVSGMAAVKTTALSASLIAGAALGQADARLIRAFDGIFTGTPDPATCANLLSGWGHSSGLDALVGFIIAHLLGGYHGEG